MKSSTLIVVAVLFVAQLVPATAAAADEDGEARTWGYRGEAGKIAPPDWPGGCGTETEQSPIDLARRAMTGEPADEIAFGYQPASSLVRDNGHAVEVVELRGSLLRRGAPPYPLCDFHFHSPSEHTVDNVGAAAEVHFVHKPRCDAPAPIVVVGALIEPAADGEDANAILALYLEGLANLPRRTPVLDPSTILPATGYRQYGGSLTTPGCGGPVTWFVAREPLRLAPAHLAALRARYPDNARPLQPIGTRTIRGPR